MLLVVVSLVLALISPGAQASGQSSLPPTQPGRGRDEGVFLTTTADDGSRVVYFVAGGVRYSILESDLGNELKLNPLWPVRAVERDDVLQYAEGAPLGTARAGLVGVAVADDEAPSIADAPSEPEVVAEPEREPEVVAASQREPEVVAESHSDPELVAEPQLDAGMVAELHAEPDVVAESHDEPELVAAESAEAPGADEVVMYVLKPGDTLLQISRAFATTIAAILQANGIGNANLIYAGQALLIPTSGGASVAAEASETTAESVRAEGIAYTVKRGDSAYMIARRFGIEVEDLLEANNVADRNRIYAGQVLTIPGQSS